MDLLYNIPQLSIVVAAGALSWRADSPLRARRPLALALGSAVVLPLFLRSDFFHLLRLMSFAVFGHLPLLLAAAGWTLGRDRTRVRAVCWSGVLLLWAVAVYAFVVEPTRLEVTRFEIHHPRVTRALRIAVLADLQTDRIGDHERRALAAVMEARPDLVLLPGDFIQAPAAERPRLAAELRALMDEVGLDAPLGVYAVQGNCDPGGWTEIFDGTPVRAFDESTRLDLGTVTVTALGLGDSFDPHLRVARPGDDGRPSIVFGHAPDFALGDVDADLLIAGHTHGGQVRLPLLGPPITFSQVPRSWAAGRTELPGDRTLVVSRGVGMERFRAPRMRFLCRPQVVIVDLEPR